MKKKSVSFALVLIFALIAPAAGAAETSAIEIFTGLQEAVWAWVDAAVDALTAWWGEPSAPVEVEPIQPTSAGLGPGVISNG